MINSRNNEKPKDKKKSIVQRIFYFASHTININKKSGKNNRKKKLKKDKKSSLSIVDFEKKISKSSIEINQDEVHTCTFCDYCDGEIVVKFTGQKIICHDFCKPNQLPLYLQKESEIELELFKSIQCDNTENVMESSDVDTLTTMKPRLSISLNDISVCGFPDYDEPTLKMRKGPVSSVEETGAHPDFLSDAGSYTFSTVDLPTIKQYGISIKKMAPVQDDVHNVDVTATILEQMTLTRRPSDRRGNRDSMNYVNNFPETLRIMIERFNDNEQGLLIEPDGDQIMGKIRVFINLLRPIKMLLTARPPSLFDVFPDNNTQSAESTLSRAYYNKETIFWLPRGTTKLLYININCPTMDVISKLLAKFNISNNPKKFALYEHTIKSPKEVEVRKLRLLQCPLKIMLDWCSQDAEYFRGNLEMKRFVLQENDPGCIEWEEFSVPELRSFLMILGQEEEEKRNDISRKYEVIRAEIRRRMTLKKSIREETISAHL